jgi:hypothetical protein
MEMSPQRKRRILLRSAGVLLLGVVLFGCVSVALMATTPSAPDPNIEEYANRLSFKVLVFALYVELPLLGIVAVILVLEWLILNLISKH